MRCRGFLAGVGAKSAAAAFPGNFTGALARAPFQQNQPAYFYRFPFGDAQVTVVSDSP